MPRWLVAVGLLLLAAAPVGAQLGVPRVVPSPLAFAPVTTLPMATRAAGTYAFTSVTVPTGVVGLQATIDISEATDPLPKVTILLEGSTDGGTTWAPAGGFDRPSGPKPRRPDTTISTTLSVIVRGGPFWSASTNANRRLRGAATIDGTLRSAMVVTPL